MNRSELFTEVQNWLSTEELHYSADEGDFEFNVRMSLDNGLVLVRLLCEESPAMLQAICTFPVKVPETKLSDTGLFLHKLNARLRIGAFHVNPEDRLVRFRMTMPIRTEVDMATQCRQAFAITLSTMEDAFSPLALFCCSTAKSRKTVAELSPKTEAPELALHVPKNRLEFN